MQQVSLYRPQYATYFPEVIQVAADPASFLPCNIYMSAIAGTASHAALILVDQQMGNNVTSWCLACIIMQYTEDVTVKLIKRGVAPKLRSTVFLNGSCMTCWCTPELIYIPASFCTIYAMLDDIQEIAISHPDIHTCEKLKGLVLAGNTRFWSISPTGIKIAEGNRNFEIVIHTFWIWFNKFVDGYM